MANHRVWIELEKSDSDEVNRERADLLSLMLERLGVTDVPHPVWWNAERRCYCFTVSPAGCFYEATDNGHWYNLEYFATGKVNGYQ